LKRRIQAMDRLMLFKEELVADREVAVWERMKNKEERILE